MTADREEQGAVLVTVVSRVDAAADALVEAQLVDADGEVWTFHVPPSQAGVDAARLGHLPQPGALRCTVVRDEMVAGILIVHIDTARPDGVTSVDGVSRFRVLRASVP